MPAELLSVTTGYRPRAKVRALSIIQKNSSVFIHVHVSLRGVTALRLPDALEPRVHAVNQEDPSASLCTATHVLGVMIRGLFTPLHSVIGHFPCKQFRSDQIFPTIWEGMC